MQKAKVYLEYVYFQKCVAKYLVEMEGACAWAQGPEHKSRLSVGKENS